VEKLAIVTFISNHETLNTGLFSLTDDLRSIIKNIKMIIYTDSTLNDTIPEGKDIEVIVMPNTTKYSRILESINNTKSDYILFIDNDITPDNDNLQKFISEITREIDLAWGYIGVSDNYGFMSKLLSVDKIYSHKILRPFLWKIKIGVSVPGQVIYMKTEKFKYDLPQYDTVFDDLTIGITAKQHNYNTACFPLILGYEKPSLSFLILVKQRIRWAKGYCQTIINNTQTGMLPYILAHGFSYHFLWIPAWIFIILTCILSIPLGILLFILTCVFLCGKKISLIVYAVIYSVIFPFIHIIWTFAFFYNIIKTKKAMRNKL
jgi:cellulose synthase/poly-beta-1,6-N-acetylglucosamine synthase-like glycosyltransferase